MTEFLASIATMFAIGALGFWALTALAAILLIWTIDSERPTSAFVLLVIYAIVLGITGSFNVVDWVLRNPLELLKYVAGYVAIGVGWAWIRWEFFINVIDRQYNEFRSEYLTTKGLTELVTDAQKKEFLDLADVHGFGSTVIPVRVNRNKARLILWMTYWPFSMPWTLIDEPVKRTFEFLYLQLGSALQARSNQKFSKYTKLN